MGWLRSQRKCLSGHSKRNKFSRMNGIVLDFDAGTRKHGLTAPQGFHAAPLGAPKVVISLGMCFKNLVYVEFAVGSPSKASPHPFLFLRAVILVPFRGARPRMGGPARQLSSSGGCVPSIRVQMPQGVCLGTVFTPFGQVFMSSSCSFAGFFSLIMD